MRTAQEIIDELGMTPIPGEGAWFVPGPRTQELSSITVLLTDQWLSPVAGATIVCATP